MIMANRAYRFTNPNRNPHQMSSDQDFAETYVEVHPGASGSDGSNRNAFGNPVSVPDWVEHDGMYKMALKDGNIVRLWNEPVVSLDPAKPSEEAQKNLVSVGAAKAAAKAVESSAPKPDDSGQSDTSPVAVAEEVSAPATDAPAKRKKAS
jgi:hypothetical protein